MDRICRMCQTWWVASAPSRGQFLAGLACCGWVYFRVQGLSQFPSAFCEHALVHSTG